MDFQPQYRKESVFRPGVWFTIKRLNSMDRASRDLEMADDLDALEELRAKAAALLPKEGDDPSAVYKKAEKRYYLFLRSKRMPVIIAHGLVKVEGMDTDTIEAFIERATDDLIDEAYALCVAASELDAAALKNWESPGTSPEPATQGQGEITIVPSAEKAA